MGTDTSPGDPSQSHQHQDSPATTSLTQNREAPENLGVVFNRQGNRRVCGSTDLLEEEPR